MIIPTKEMKSGAILKKEKQMGYKPDPVFSAVVTVIYKCVYSD